MKENNLQVLVLAAGQGKRMNVGDLPKVLVPLKGKPMLGYLLDAIKKSGVCDNPTIVIGKGADEVKDTFGPDNQYVLQEEQLGTGHAVMVAKEALKDATDIMILYGDHPLISPQLIKNLADKHLSSGSILTMATVKVDDFDDWRSELASFAKIIKNENGKVVQVIERKDANEQQAKIKELNPAYMCIKADWLWENLEKVGKENAQGEYYLTDLVKMAVDQGNEIATIEALPKEALGINSSEQLETIEKLL